jgi:hypothetical protein
MDKEKNEFWNSLLTEKSWMILQELPKKYKFILIGGWAVWLLTRQNKSKDVDIVVSIEELEKLKQEILRKNDRLKKYEIKKEEVDIDIYLEYYSELAIPVEDIKNYTLKIGVFDVACPELLLILKQKAYSNRKNSIKGEKDRIDIISLLFFCEIDFKRYYEILKKYKIEDYLRELKTLLFNFKEYSILGLSPREFKLKKGKLRSELRRI